MASKSVEENDLEYIFISEFPDSLDREPIIEVIDPNKKETNLSHVIAELKSINSNITSIGNIVWEQNREFKSINRNTKSILNILKSLNERQDKLFEEQELIKADLLYEKYRKELEEEESNIGKFVAISPEGGYAIGEEAINAIENAKKEGLGKFILYKIGGTIDI